LITDSRLTEDSSVRPLSAVCDALRVARAVLTSAGTVYDVVGEIAAAMCFLAVSSGVASPGIDSGPMLRLLILAVPI